ncbi:FaeA/PapI family transcriptional regulator [Serratia microhaemolytica]|uniref:FaeA/PapI family transcriptional regulator n=1 Tax=Serratia microhaemolytica TaxID=2675110 RepID=UPI000FDE39D3|nr:FaeA/PapI family transcriptional regulator [Serratia microhaemolytica]
MVVFTSKKQISQSLLHKKILKHLLSITSCAEQGMPPPQQEWPSTRQIADAHDISIYKARLLLLDLVKQNQIMVSDCSIKNSLRWYPLRQGSSSTHQHA